MSFHQLRSPRFNNVLDNPGGTPPTVTTQAATSVGTNTATANGTLVSIGSSAVTVMGFVWATHSNPTLADNVVNDAGTSLGTFTDTLMGLPAGTLIFYDAYATNAVGTSYGGDQSFTTSALVSAFSATFMMMGV